MIKLSLEDSFFLIVKVVLKDAKKIIKKYKKCLVFRIVLVYNNQARVRNTHTMDSLIRALVPKMVDVDRLSKI
jgi:hypothetical protein